MCVCIPNLGCADTTELLLSAQLLRYYRHWAESGNAHDTTVPLEHYLLRMRFSTQLRGSAPVPPTPSPATCSPMCFCMGLNCTFRLRVLRGLPGGTDTRTLDSVVSDFEHCFASLCSQVPSHVVLERCIDVGCFRYVAVVARSDTSLLDRTMNAAYEVQRVAPARVTSSKALVPLGGAPQAVERCWSRVQGGRLICLVSAFQW